MRARFTPTRAQQLVTVTAMHRVQDWEAARDPHAVAFARRTPAADMLFGRAEALARDGREDRGAVDELRKLASGNDEALRDAEARTRIAGTHRENLVPNRAHRLLDAVLRNQAVAAVQTDDLRRFAAVAAFEELGPDEKWTQLVALEPRLVDLEREVQRGTFIHRPGHAVNALEKSERRRRQRDDAQRWFALQDQIDALLGPASGNTNLLAASRAARSAAGDHLESVAKEL